MSVQVPKQTVVIQMPCAPTLKAPMSAGAWKVLAVMDETVQVKDS